MRALLKIALASVAAAVVGGTGAYRGARGEAVIVEGPKQTGTITFRLAR